MKPLLLLAFIIYFSDCPAQEDLKYSYNGRIRETHRKMIEQLYHKNKVSSYSLYSNGIRILTMLIDKQGREWKHYGYRDDGDTASISTSYFDQAGRETEIRLLSDYGNRGKWDSTFFRFSYNKTGFKTTELWIERGVKYDSTVYTDNEHGDIIFEKTFYLLEPSRKPDSSVYTYEYDNSNMMIKLTETGSLTVVPYIIEISYEDSVVKTYTWPGSDMTTILYDLTNRPVLKTTKSASGTSYSGNKYLPNGLIQLEGNLFYEYTYSK